MDVRDAVKAAKDHVKIVFADEALSTPRLEEVWFDESSSKWFITVGIVREKPDTLSALSRLTNHPLAKLSENKYLDYKTVEIDDKNGKAISIRNRELAA